MIPAGYMAKRVATQPDSRGAAKLGSIYSVSPCLSENFADYINYWQHNGYWLFDSPGVIAELAKRHAIDLTGTVLFYYEVYEYQFDEKGGRWDTFGPEPSFRLDVKNPGTARLEGYDVVCFPTGNDPGCSPLSCNGLAMEIETNRHWLLSSLDEARNLLESGRFVKCEPGPYRIFAVYSLEWP